ncbi:hypothetical protein B0T13DRAFT_407933 [Neurospora crassa]|nr:hypothetical protein B0T13DRAFT_407933 [Neurospora crassa]
MVSPSCPWITTQTVSGVSFRKITGSVTDRISASSTLAPRVYRYRRQKSATKRSNFIIQLCTINKGYYVYAVGRKIARWPWRNGRHQEGPTWITCMIIGAKANSACWC